MDGHLVARRQPPRRERRHAVGVVVRQLDGRAGPVDDDPTIGQHHHTIDVAHTELALLRPMCFRSGGILRLQNVGPGMVSASPSASRSHTASRH